MGGIRQKEWILKKEDLHMRLIDAQPTVLGGLVQDALEKQMPQKPIRAPWSIAKCPTCGCELGEWLEDGYHKDYEDT